ncbi:hypothetical protein BCD67_04985 [Oscillatoriales cyanobacterium USR001]|nr:hypothetical protein BCD67_04985 [Oscillatoriales cyanobacterium USR001]
MGGGGFIHILVSHLIPILKNFATVLVGAGSPKSLPLNYNLVNPPQLQIWRVGAGLFISWFYPVNLGEPAPTV